LGISLFALAASLRQGFWSIDAALAEKNAPLQTFKRTRTKPAAMQSTQAPAATQSTQAFAAAQTDTVEVVAPPSSVSRLIALVGTLVLTAVMLGVGYGMIWSLFTKGQIPALEGIGPYLLGSSALFAPYAFNQLKEAFKKDGQ